MSRDFASIERGAAHAEGTRQSSEISGLPPGYIDGYQLKLDNDLKVTVGAGIANVNGKQVTNPDNHILRDTDWLGSKVGPRFYYICIDDGGMFKVTGTEPVYDEEKISYYDPRLGYRAIGKLWVDTDADIKFVTSQFTETFASVTVASAAYTGTADYYCIYAHDEILIQAAGDFLAHCVRDDDTTGGVLEFTEGHFLVEDEVAVGDYMWVRGRGRSTVLVRNVNVANKNLFACEGTAGVHYHTVIFSDFYIKRNDTTSYGYIYTNYVDSVRCEGIEFYQGLCSANPDDGVLAINNTKKVYVIGCRWWRFADADRALLFNAADGMIINNTFDCESVNGATNAAIYLFASSGDVIVAGNIIKNIDSTSTCYGIFSSNATGNLQIKDNIITNLNNSAANSYGIFLESSDDAIVSGNTVNDITSTSGSGYGIYTDSTDDALLEGNVVKNCSTDGIYIDNDCNRILVMDNIALDNGADVGVSNTNEDNFDDNGTDTFSH